MTIRVHFQYRRAERMADEGSHRRAGADPRTRLLAANRVAAVALAALGAACVVLRLDRADLWTPFSYSSDALVQAAWAKALLEHGSIHTNPSLGAPFGQVYYDFPLFESVNFALQRLLGRIGGSWAFAVNAYYLLTFPLTAACAYVALVTLGVSGLSSATASIVYTLLPYHLYRGETHLFLSGYHFVPLAALVALRIAIADGPGRFVLAAVVMLLSAGSGIYYGFFTAFFLVVAALFAAIRRRTWRPPLVAGALLGILVLGGLLNVAPTLSYWAENGTTVVTRRTPADSLRHGFRIAAALMPIPDHRVAAFARVRESFTLAAPAPTRFANGAQSLGVVASVGLVGLLLVPFATHLSGTFRQTLLALSCLTWAGVLLATTGGLGLLFAFFVTPDIRAWDRIVPFLAFFALAAVAIALDSLRARTRACVAVAAGTVVLGLVAVADQTSPRLVPQYATTREAVASDRSFFGGIERAVPEGSMLFQLPYVPFPEQPPLHGITDYDLFRPYLSTRSLRWSYGAVRTRFADAWIASVARRTPAEMVDALALAGFRGIVVDRHGYEDGGAGLDGSLRAVTGPPASSSEDGRYTWYRLDVRAAELRAAIGDAAFAGRRDRLLHPIYLEWQRGFHAAEGSQRWSDARSTVAVDNPRRTPAQVRITTSVCSGTPEPAAFTMRSAALEYSGAVTSACIEVDIAATLPPGRTRIHFSTEAPRVDAPADTRALHFRLRGFRLVPADGNADVIQNM